MVNLKAFLKYRDTYEEFKPVKEAGNVGIPCILVNNGEKIIFDYKNYNF